MPRLERCVEVSRADTAAMRLTLELTDAAVLRQLGVRLAAERVLEG